MDAAKKTYMAKNREETTAAYKKWVEVFKDKYPKAVLRLEKNIENMLIFFVSPKA